MGCKSYAQQVDEAVKVETLQGSDLFSIVRSSTTNGITFQNLVTQLGVTGSLTDSSAGGATPVLSSVSANNYNLRGIIGARGVSVGLDSQDNIEIRSNFANAGTTTDGAAIVPDVTATQIQFRRIQGGEGIDVIQNGDKIIVQNSEAAATTETVIINSVDDFPAPVSGVIQLEGKDYLITSDVSTSNRFQVPSNQACVIRSADRAIVQLQSTTTGDMFTGTTPNLTIKNISISCPNGQFANLSSPSQSGQIELFKINLTCDRAGQINNLSACIFQSVVYNQIITRGWSFTGAIGAVQGFSNFVINQLAGIFLDLDSATFIQLSFEDTTLIQASVGTTFISGLPNNGNMVTGAIAVIDQAVTSPNMTPLVGVSATDAQWRFSNCNAILDTEVGALGYLSTQQATTISTVSTPVVLNGNGAFTSVNESQMTINNNGRITYNGVNDEKIDITAIVSLEPATGARDAYSVYFAKNNVVIAGSRGQGSGAGGDPSSITALWQDIASNGDFYEIYLANESDTSDILCTVSTFRIG